ncbi:potassium channel family protein [Chloroflexota bacterium]
MGSRRRALWGGSILLAIIAVGTTGYTVIEGWSFLDSLYMTVITITTVGYAEVHPLSISGRIFSIFLIIGGVSGALFTLTGIIEYVLEGNIRTTWGRRSMKNKIAGLKDHIILCGFGRVGEEISRTFKEEGAPFVVIENNPERVSRAEQEGYLCLPGDATSDEVLKEAGIERARGLVAALGTDADNTYITLSGRELRPDLFIEARASGVEAEKKLRSAGANRIVSPTSIGARRMAMLAMRPAVVDFIDTITRNRGPELQLENVAINNESTLAGQTVDDVRQCSKANVLAINKKTGRLIPNPSGEEKIQAGDSLIMMGTSEQLSSLEAICEGVKLNE